MNQSCGGGGLCHRLSHGAGRAMETTFRCARLVKTGAHLAEPPRCCGGGGLQGHGAGRAMALFRSRARLVKTGANLAEPSFLSRANLSTTASRLLGAKQTSRLNCSASNGEQPPSSDEQSASSLSAQLAEPATKHRCIDPSPSSVPSAPSPDLLRQVDKKLDFMLQKMDFLGVKQIIWRMVATLLSVLSICIVIVTVYTLVGGRAYIEEEVKAMFLSITSDPEVKERMRVLIKEAVDTTVRHISSRKTWYKWLRGK